MKNTFIQTDLDIKKHILKLFNSLLNKNPINFLTSIYKSSIYYLKIHKIQDLLIIISFVIIFLYYLQTQFKKPFINYNFINGIVEKTNSIALRLTNKKIIITSSNGDRYEFSITPETIIYGKSWKPYTTNAINLKDSVKIKYIETSNGNWTATAITLKQKR